MRSALAVPLLTLAWLLGQSSRAQTQEVFSSAFDTSIRLKSESLLTPRASANQLAAYIPSFDITQEPIALRSSPVLLIPIYQDSSADLAQATGSIGALKSSIALQEKLSHTDQRGLTFVFGDRIQGRPNLETVVDGNAQLRRRNLAFRADRLEYYQPEDLVKTQGKVHINNQGNQFEGEELILKMDTFEGTFKQPKYHFLKGGGYGQAQRVEFLDESRSVVYQGTYTTCQPENEASWSPDWIVTADRVTFDQEADTGTATNGLLRFKGVPVLYAPSLSFPLSDKRKSGLLPPTTIIDKVSGTQLTAPYYFDIAPNRDATLSPTWMSKRGWNLGNEFRYLETEYRGQVQLDVMPQDALRNHSRWAYSLIHSGSWSPYKSAITDTTNTSNSPNIGVSLNLNRVSDANYWRDFPRSLNTFTQRSLPNDALLTWNRDDLSTSLRVSKYQTLQDPGSVLVTPPYDLQPQISVGYQRTNSTVAGLPGVDWSVSTNYSSFHSDASLTGQPNAQRLTAQGQISYPWITPGWFVTPKLLLNAANYRFDTRLSNGAQSAGRVVPTVSLDSGLVFERNAQFLGHHFTQTLEPRAFYVYTPFRDQSLLPNYDSGTNDFNFSSVYTENAFAGSDRISDSNLLTLGVTSRLLDAQDGSEVLRLGVAQRLRFSDQNVTLPGGTPIKDRISDLLLGATANVTSKWRTDGFVQYNPKTGYSERTTLGATYSPGRYRMVSAAYRYQRASSEQLDFNWQWPINDLWGDKGQDLGPGRGLGGRRWYSVGRINYNAIDKKVVDGLVGLEYDGCCWIGRIVLDRTQLTNSSSNVRLLFQLEFVGFSRLGPNPIKALRANIPRYELLREQGTPPSRFTSYD